MQQGPRDPIPPHCQLPLLLHSLNLNAHGACTGLQPMCTYHTDVYTCEPLYNNMA